MNIKKLIIISFALTLIFIFSACGSETEVAPTPTEENVPSHNQVPDNPREDISASIDTDEPERIVPSPDDCPLQGSWDCRKMHTGSCDWSCIFKFSGDRFTDADGDSGDWFLEDSTLTLVFDGGETVIFNLTAAGDDLLHFVHEESGMNWDMHRSMASFTLPPELILPADINSPFFTNIDFSLEGPWNCGYIHSGRCFWACQLTFTGSRFADRHGNTGDWVLDGDVLTLAFDGNYNDEIFGNFGVRKFTATALSVDLIRLIIEDMDWGMFRDEVQVMQIGDGVPDGMAGTWKCDTRHEGYCDWPCALFISGNGSFTDGDDDSGVLEFNGSRITFHWLAMNELATFRYTYSNDTVTITGLTIGGEKDVTVTLVRL